MAYIHFADAGYFNGTFHAARIGHAEAVSHGHMQHFGEPLRNDRAIVDHDPLLMRRSIAQGQIRAEIICVIRGKQRNLLFVAVFAGCFRQFLVMCGD